MIGSLEESQYISKNACSAAYIKILRINLSITCITSQTVEYNVSVVDPISVPVRHCYIGGFWNNWNKHPIILHLRNSRKWLYIAQQRCFVYFDANRVINAWNNLPTSVIFTSLPVLVGLLGALILEIFWNVIVVNLKGSC